MAEGVFCKWHGEFANFEEGYLRHYVALADTKAAVVFGVSSTILAYLVSNKKFVGAFEGDVAGATILAASVGVSFLLSALLAVSVVMPRLPKGAEGIVFFGAVNRLRDSSEYRQKVAKCTESDLTAARLDHCFTIAGVCWSKYRNLRAAMWSGLAAIFLLGLLLPTIADQTAVGEGGTNSVARQARADNTQFS